MLAELAAVNSAFSIVKQFVANGRDLSDCFQQISTITNAKEMYVVIECDGYVVVDNDLENIKNGILGDIAPTILKLMGIKKPKEMTQESLI